MFTQSLYEEKNLYIIGEFKEETVLGVHHWLSYLIFFSGKQQYQAVSVSSRASKSIATIEEYRVENIHSIIRAQTPDDDPPSMLEKKARALFQEM